LNDEILASIESSWHDWREIPPSWFRSEEAINYSQRLRLLFESNFGDAPLAVLKEPRMCRMLPLWEPIFREAGVRPLYCFIDRDPMEVATSLQRRHGSTITHWLLYYIRNHLDSEFATRGHPRAFVSYNNLLSDWRRTLGRVEAALGIKLSITKERNEEVDVFLDRELRHENGVDASPDASLETANAISKIFDTLSANPRDKIACKKLDHLRDAMNKRQHALEIRGLEKSAGLFRDIQIFGSVSGIAR
jgi:hypothetical protein